MSEGRVVIIGGGVVGVCCALQLQRDGRAVTILERNPPGEGTAWASCGLIAVSEIVPLARPGILRQVPGWLLDPTGPLRLRPASLPGLLPWFARFILNARPQRIETLAAQLAVLTGSALEDYYALLRPLGLGDLIRGQPVLELYDTESGLVRDRKHHELRRVCGFRIDEISGAEAAEMEPAIAKDFAKAAVFRDWRSVVDTKRFVTAMIDAFTVAGGDFLAGEARGFARVRDRVIGVVLANGTQIEAGQIVVAAGAWSKRLAAQLGVRLSLEGVAGYQTVIADPGILMEHAVIYAEGGFVMTPMESGLAIGGTIEFSGLDARPNFRRAKILVSKARRVLPGLRSERGEERIGYRPLCPDTLPVIDRAPAAPNVLIATGHGQLGSAALSSSVWIGVYCENERINI